MLFPSARRLLLLVLGLLSSVAFAAAKDLPRPEAGKLTVYYFDVGQGDSALIVSPTGKTVLVDGGPPEAGASLAEKVRALVGHPLDLVVLTHPHLDHLGGLDDVIRAVGTRRYLDPGFDMPSSHYRRLLDLVAERKIAYVEPKPGEGGTPVVIGIGGGAALTVFWPRVPVVPFLSGTRSDANANSVVFRLSFGKTAFLFTGDSEADTEEQVLALGQPLSATVLKVAHHGSKYSSTARFLAAVSPKVAVISCGLGNDYHHPHPSLLHRLGDTGAKILRTDLAGDVRVVSDGTSLTAQTISREGTVTFAGSFEGTESLATTAPVAGTSSATHPAAAPAPSTSFAAHPAVAPSAASTHATAVHPVGASAPGASSAAHPAVPPTAGTSATAAHPIGASTPGASSATHPAVPPSADTSSATHPAVAPAAGTSAAAAHPIGASTPGASSATHPAVPPSGGTSSAAHPAVTPAAGTSASAAHPIGASAASASSTPEHPAVAPSASASAAAHPAGASAHGAPSTSVHSSGASTTGTSATSEHAPGAAAHGASSTSAHPTGASAATASPTAKHPATTPEPQQKAGVHPVTGYVASRNSHVFHRADCPAVERILPKNLIHYDDRAAAAKDRRPAGDCHP